MTDLSEQINFEFGRADRRGYPEAVLCEGKTVDQVRQIALEIANRESSGAKIFTRISDSQAAAVKAVLPNVFYEPEARFLASPGEFPEPSGGMVAVVSAGTSDYPVAREASLTAQFLGRHVVEIIDVGVAGLHRVLARVDDLRAADVVIVAAGMDAALVPVVTGLVSAPVVAVPTSVGYGASFGGVSALLSMLNSCAPGVGVVNIDNGYGAGHLASQIAEKRAANA